MRKCINLRSMAIVCSVHMYRCAAYASSHYKHCCCAAMVTLPAMHAQLPALYSLLACDACEHQQCDVVKQAQSCTPSGELRQTGPSGELRQTGGMLGGWPSKHSIQDYLGCKPAAQVLSSPTCSTTSLKNQLTCVALRYTALEHGPCSQLLHSCFQVDSFVCHCG